MTAARLDVKGNLLLILPPSLSIGVGLLLLGVFELCCIGTLLVGVGIGMFIGYRLMRRLLIRWMVEKGFVKEVLRDEHTTEP